MYKVLVYDGDRLEWSAVTRHRVERNARSVYAEARSSRCWEMVAFVLVTGETFDVAVLDATHPEPARLADVPAFLAAARAN